MIAEPSDCIAPAVTWTMVKTLTVSTAQRKWSNAFAAPWPLASHACSEPEAYPSCCSQAKRGKHRPPYLQPVRLLKHDGRELIQRCSCKRKSTSKNTITLIWVYFVDRCTCRGAGTAAQNKQTLKNINDNVSDGNRRAKTHPHLRNCENSATSRIRCNKVRHT
jgi:hypothetical protein